MGSKWKIYAAVAALLLLGTVLVVRWAPWQPKGPGPGFVSGNGRIEATEIAVSTKLAGRVQDILVAEGDFVKAGQPVARMQIDGLQAQREEAVARLQQAQLAMGLVLDQLGLVVKGGPAVVNGQIDHVALAQRGGAADAPTVDLCAVRRAEILDDEALRPGQ